MSKEILFGVHGLAMSLCAKGGADHIRLDLSYLPDDRAFGLTLLGMYEGKDIQIDFELLGVADIEDLIAYLQRRLAHAKEAA